MDAKKHASLQAARATRGRKRKHAKERNKILCNNLSFPKLRRDDKSFTDDFDFHLLIRELKNGYHYCRQRPCQFPREFFKIKDLRVLIKFKLCARAVRGCDMFLLTIPLKLTRSSSWLAYIQVQVTPTLTPT